MLITVNNCHLLFIPEHYFLLQVCTDYLENACTHLENDCPLAHPPPLIVPDHEGFVTVCMDFMKGTCQRHACRYFHPPPHLQAKVKAAQMRPGQIPVSLAAAGVPVYPSPMVRIENQGYSNYDFKR